jgi:hypothetical protein
MQHTKPKKRHRGSIETQQPLSEGSKSFDSGLFSSDETENLIPQPKTKIDQAKTAPKKALPVKNPSNSDDEGSALEAVLKWACSPFYFSQFGMTTRPGKML